MDLRVAFICFAAVTTQCSLALQLTLGHAPISDLDSVLAKKGGKQVPQPSSSLTATHTDEAGFPSDNLTVWGSPFKPNGRKPQMAIGLSCPKCGSSYFYSVLSKHPSIAGGMKKETEYFSGNDGNTRKPRSVCASTKDDGATFSAKYVNACFSANTKGQPQNPWKMNKTLFEFTPGYLTQAADDAALMMGFKAVDDGADLRFIAVLRNPVERYVSELNMLRLHGNVAQEMSNKGVSEFVLQKVSEETFSIRLGHHAHSLRQWLNNFPAERLLVVNQLALDDERTWKRVLGFLGLSSHHEGTDVIPEMLAEANKHEEEVRNPEKGYLKLSDRAMEKLKHHYASHDAKLWKLLNVKPWWTA